MSNLDFKIIYFYCSKTCRTVAVVTLKILTPDPVFIVTRYKSSFPGGVIVLYLCVQVAVLYTYNCLLILKYYRLGLNLLIIINKYAIKLVQD